MNKLIISSLIGFILIGCNFPLDLVDKEIECMKQLDKQNKCICSTTKSPEVKDASADATFDPGY